MTQNDSGDQRYLVTNIENITPIDCPCGQARRAFTDDPDQTASLHVVNIKQEAATHYHKKMTELYYVLHGEGFFELDGDRIPVRPGFSAMIKPGCRHRAVGNLTILNVPIPAFDPDDEWFD